MKLFRNKLLLSLVAFFIVGNALAQYPWISGFEDTDPVFTYNSTTNTAARIAALPRTGTWRGGFSANGTYDGCIITPLLTFTNGNTYTITVYARAKACTGKLQIYKNITATNAAMKASIGGDIILSSGIQNVTSTTYTLFTASWVCTGNESKYVGFQMIGINGGGCGTMNIGIDDIVITETVGAPPCNITGNDACAGAGTPTLNGSCCSSTLNGAIDHWTGTVGCQSGNNPEVWFSGTAAAGQDQMVFSVNNLGVGFGGNIELVVVSATGSCSGLAIEGSFCGPSPMLDSLQVIPGTTYYWTVSSSAGSNGATSTFDICVTNNVYVDNSACNINDVLTANPLPTVNSNYPLGSYPPNTTVQFTYNITGWDVGASCNWLEGIVPSWGSGWDPASFTITLNPVNASSDNGSWGWWTVPVLHNISGANINPNGGWFYCNPDPGTAIPGTPCIFNNTTNWGDGCIGNDWYTGMWGTGCNTGCDAVAYAALSWTVDFTLTTRATAALCASSSSDLNVNVKTYADGEIGSWTSIGCMVDVAMTNGNVLACCVDPNSTLTWNGGSTDWFLSDNWGECIIPSCTNDINIPNIGASSVIGSAGATCRNVTINPSATLQLNAGATLSICGNFTNNGTFTAAAGSTVIFVGSVAQTIGGSTITTFDNLTINNTSATGVTLNTTTNVAGALTLTDGIVYTSTTAGANPFLRINAGGTSSSGSSASFVNGFIRKTGNSAFVFPTGNGAKWRRIGIDAPSASTEFEARYINAPYSNTTSMAATPTPILTHVSLVEHWILNKPGAAASTKVTLFWENAVLSGIFKFDSLTVGRFGAAWEDANCYGSCPANWTSSTTERTYSGSATGTGAGTIRSNTVSSFSPFTFTSIGINPLNPLPVELFYFNVECKENKAIANWVTTSETNSDYFTLEKSTDTRTFYPIATVKAAGNSSDIQNYFAEDSEPFTTATYYRLTQTDFDGSTTIYNMVAIKGCGIDEITAFSNENIITVIVNSKKESIYNIELYDVMGKKILNKKEIFSSGKNKVTFEFNATDGIYFIKVFNNNNEFIQKLSIQK